MLNNKILILGSNGFIGKNIKKSFQQEKKYIIFECTRKEADILVKEQLDDYFKQINPDIVINCCGVVGSSLLNCETNEYEIFHHNLLMHMNILDCCKKYKVQKMIHFSTYRIFGKNMEERYNESCIDNGNITNNTGYLLSKKIFHTQLDLFQKYNQDIHYVCFILPNIFGKYDTFINNGRIIPSFIKKINEAKKKDIDLIIDSNSYNQVNLIYVEDLFAIILQTLEQEDNNDKHLIQGNVIVFNEEGIFNLEEIINYLKEEMQFEKNILFTKKEPLPLEEKNIMKPDLTKLKSFYNNYTFSDIKIKLKETIDHFYSVETGIL